MRTHFTTEDRALIKAIVEILREVADMIQFMTKTKAALEHAANDLEGMLKRAL